LGLVNSDESKKINEFQKVEEILEKVTQTDFITEEKQLKEEDLKKKIEKAKIEADVLRKISIVNINNNTFSPNNNVQQTAITNSTPNQVSSKEEVSR